MTDDLFNPADARLAADPERDPMLGELLRAERLRERIALAVRRRGMRRIETPWYGWVARYGRAAVPIGIAAALIAAVILNRTVRSDADYAAQAASTDLRGAVAGGSGSAVTDAMLGPDSTEFLIAMAVER